MARVFSMPDVQVGSILEYQFELQYDDGWIFWPEWTLQERVFVHDPTTTSFPTRWTSTVRVRSWCPMRRGI